MIGEYTWCGVVGTDIVDKDLAQQQAIQYGQQGEHSYRPPEDGCGKCFDNALFLDPPSQYPLCRGGAIAATPAHQTESAVT